MSVVCRRIFLYFCLMLVAGVPAFAATWTDPTPEELKMTSDPAAPDAPAVYLFREETVNDKTHSHTLYVRVKILDEKGKQEFSEIEIPYEKGESGQDVVNVQGRTIEPDGTVVPFTGKPYNKELLKSGDEKVMSKVFSLPDVRVGSIVEYRYVFIYESNYFIAPRWLIQQNIFVRQAHYHFVPTDTSRTITSTDSLGHTSTVSHLVYLPLLPPGAKVREGLDGFDLTVNNIPPIPDEQFMAPLSSFSYRLVFYYTAYLTQEEFWKEEGKFWSKDVNRFAEPSGKIQAAVAQLVAPGDSDDQKLQKIYAAVMTVENTDFTRQHSAEESKAEGQKAKSAADIWEQKRGSSKDITRLFIAMARAAGMKAYAMAVTSGDQSVMNPGYLTWGQLTDKIAIVAVGGKETYFDPGERYCEFGKLSWIHTQMYGVRQIEGGTKVVQAPVATYKNNVTLRNVHLTMGPDGKLQGQIQLTMVGVEALRWRQLALQSDEEATKRALEKQMQREVPAGVQVKMNRFLALNDSSLNLIALLDVSGGMGTATGKRVFLPATFFEAESKPLFAPEKRESAIDLRYPYYIQDEVQITLPPGMKVESLPKDTTTVSPLGAEYKSTYINTADGCKQTRLMAVGYTLYTPKEYPQLRTFFQGASAQDHEQMVLARTPVEAVAPPSQKGQ